MHHADASSLLRRAAARGTAICLAAGLLSLAAPARAQDMSGYRNMGFEDGVRHWRVWYSDDSDDPRPRYPYTSDAGHPHSGKRSLKITATARGGRAFVHQSSTALKPNTRYEVSYWFRTEAVEPSALAVLFNFRPKLPGGKLGRMKRLNSTWFRPTTQGEWTQRRGRMRTFPEPCAAQLGIYLQDAEGSVWVDDVVVRELAAEEDSLADLWEYDPHRVELLGKPEAKFRRLTERGESILKLAQAYNGALVRSAFAKDAVRRADRAAYWARAHGLSAEATDLRKRCREMESALADLYRLYGEAYLASRAAASPHKKAPQQSDPEKHSRFTPAAGALEKDIAALRADADRAVRCLQGSLRSHGLEWPPQPALLSAGLPEIAADGTPNQIIYGTRSLWNHGFMEKPLDINALHSVTIGSPRSIRPEQYDWSAILKQWKDMTDNCPAIRRGCLPVWFALHDTSYCPPWLRRRIRDDGELMLQTDPPQEFRKRGGRTQLNWWHPEIQAFARRCLADMGRTMKPHSQFLFYVTQAECLGPIAAVEGKPWRRQVGYSSHARRSFRSYLTRKYGTPAKLNATWGTDHASFDSIRPPADKYVQPRKTATPLSAEWEKWREDSYTDWCRLIYRSLKKADGKPVLASHSQLLDKVSAARAYETCDILGYHNRAPRFMINTLYTNTISRCNGFKPLGQYENFWGCQEHHDRMTDELVQRRNMAKHVFRLTAWGRFVQIWWYAYTTASYLTLYDGNWFDPVYALTTLRYRTAALPVHKDKFKRLERDLLRSRPAHYRICLLQPSAALRNEYPYDATMREIIAWHELLFRRNDLYELVPEEYFQDGRAEFDDFDVLVLPYAVYLPTAVQQGIEKWLASGKRLLIASGPFGLYDEIARPTERFARLLGAGRPRLEQPDKGGWRWRVARAAEHAASIRRTHRDSRIIVLLRPLDRAAEGTRAELVRAVERAATRPASCRNNRFELVVREVDRKTRYLLVLNPDVDSAHEDVVVVRGAWRRAEDVDIPGAVPVALADQGAARSFRLRLGPCEMAAVRLTR